MACAAKLCYASADIGTVMEGLTEEKTASFLDMLGEIGHESPIEHASFTFGIEGVSVRCWRRLRATASPPTVCRASAMSGEDDFEFVLPPEIEGIPEAKEEFLQAMVEDARHYERLTALLKEKHRKEFLTQGEDEKSAARKAEKKAIEDARFVLPNACATKMICTMNARSLMNFLPTAAATGRSGKSVSWLPKCSGR